MKRVTKPQMNNRKSMQCLTRPWKLKTLKATASSCNHLLISVSSTSFRSWQPTTTTSVPTLTATTSWFDSLAASLSSTTTVSSWEMSSSKTWSLNSVKNSSRLSVYQTTSSTLSLKAHSSKKRWKRPRRIKQTRRKRRIKWKYLHLAVFSVLWQQEKSRS